MTCIYMYTAHLYVHSTFVLIGNIKTNIFRCYTKHSKIFHAFKTPAQDIGEAVIEQVAHQFVGH